MSVLESDSRQRISFAIVLLATGALIAGFGFRRAALHVLGISCAAIAIGGIFFVASIMLFSPARGGMSSMADGLAATGIIIVTGAVGVLVFLVGGIYSIVRRKKVFERQSMFIPLLVLAVVGYGYVTFSARAAQREAHPAEARLVDRLLDPNFHRYAHSEVLNELRSRGDHGPFVEEFTGRLQAVPPNQYRIVHYSVSGLERGFIFLGMWCGPDCIPVIQPWADYDGNATIQEAAQDAIARIKGRAMD